jgi:PAS domain S-box-containing protein
MKLFDYLRRYRWPPALFALGIVVGRLLGRRKHAPAPPSTSARSHQIIFGASEAIISADAGQRIVAVNPSAAAMFGTTVREMHGSLLNRFIRLHAAHGHAADISAICFGNGSGPIGVRATDYGVTGIKPGGFEFPLEGSIATLYEETRPITTFILRDITERQQVERRLTHSHEQLRQLSSMLQSIREEERSHIARELHDDLGQRLASLRIDLALLQRQSAASSKPLLDGMDERLLGTITALRRIAANLRPRALDEGGLYFALQALRRDFVDQYGIACELLADEPDLRLDDTTSTTIYRVVQESLTNIARHANATRVTISADRIDSQFLLTIHDDGRGIAAAEMEKAQSLGLVGMRERVAALHGDITISADEPPGTRIDVILPIIDRVPEKQMGPP